MSTGDCHTFGVAKTLTQCVNIINLFVKPLWNPLVVLCFRQDFNGIHLVFGTVLGVQLE